MKFFFLRFKFFKKGSGARYLDTAAIPEFCVCVLPDTTHILCVEGFRGLVVCRLCAFREVERKSKFHTQCET